MAEEKATLTEEQIDNAATNRHGVYFTIKGQPSDYEIRDLDYDSYIQFCRCAKPILEAIAGGLKVEPGKDNTVDIGFDPLAVDFDSVLGLAEKDLPTMAHICLRQSADKLTVKEVKRLLPRPQLMLEVILQQIKQNDLVREFADFFPRLSEALNALVPEVAQMMAPPPSTTEEIPS